jgi:hypothetical protein
MGRGRVGFHVISKVTLLKMEINDITKTQSDEVHEEMNSSYSISQVNGS